MGVAALLVTNIVDQFLPLLLKNGVDELRLGQKHFYSLGLSLLLIAFWVLMLRPGAVLLQGFLRYGWRFGFYGMGRRVEYGMRKELFEKLLSLPPAYYLKHRLGDLLSRAMSDLTTVRESLGNGWLTVLDSFSGIGLSLLFMLHLDWRLTLLILAPMVFIPPLIATVGRQLRQLTFTAQDALDELSQAATESFRGAKVIQAYAVGEAESQRFQLQSRSYRDKNMAMVRLEAWYWPLLFVFAGFSELFLFYFGAQHIAASRGAYLGTFMAMQGYLGMVLFPVMGLGFSTNAYVRGKVSVERLNEIYDQVPEIQSGPKEGAANAAPFLALQGVSFAYEGAAAALHKLELSSARGEWLGLAGRTGSGKSTLLSLLPRLRDPQEGQIQFEGLDLKEWRLGILRRKIGIVMQEPFIFSDTILNNVAFAAENADLEEARAWAKVADLDDFIMSLPEAYASLLGEKGVNLSGGQKQRLALARALYSRPELLLLDDAFSAVDTATEARIVERLKEALPESSVILVSHRSSTLRLCGRIVVLEKGEIVEDGAHEDLMQREGYYFEMLRREQLARRSGLESL
jgi:ATP-binding cassette subfamily B multidrug efflux pump